ncbi:hypothetical protein LUZ60_005187 [Juncus effusus]|nr:hypothetical protein LUZ60_005187 [Juncus effusus]
MVGEVNWSSLGSFMASFLFLWAIVKDYMPLRLEQHASNFITKILSFIYLYDQITVHEHSGEHMTRNELYSSAEAYLSSVCLHRARKLKAELGKESDKPLVTIDDHEEVTDDFEGVKIWWYSAIQRPNSSTISWYPGEEERRYYRISFHRRNRELIESAYLKHVLKQGRDFTISNRQRRLFTNNPSSNWEGHRRSIWSHVAFEHPATFNTLAMDPTKKKEILDDLVTFQEGKDYYKQIGKAWKRGYLLYGPPGTGKSTMIAAMANFLEYDIYDLELTAVQNNRELRKIFIETSGKSIIVIEDVDCSLDLTGKRKEKKKKDDEEKEKKPPVMGDKDETSKVTLSGLLNFIDGLWSSCGSERIIIFTTNHVDKLDLALIRRGRMDMHIEMSYCTFEAFKALAKNYIGIEEHDLFETIRGLLSEVNMTPADVAEGLMPRKNARNDAKACLENLIKDLKMAKEDAERAEQIDAKTNGDNNGS